MGETSCDMCGAETPPEDLEPTESLAGVALLCLRCAVDGARGDETWWWPTDGEEEQSA
jgi:hypothetical protein